ncbi:TIGR03936 family radical SAM-associated protein [Planctomycetota bacterium]|nr:TIGR03936 family radical SAM-associated protein [Planctomycetota bacterium]
MANARYRLRFEKREALRFISHHDLMRSFELALRRSKLPLAFTQGFNPHPKVSFALALPLGVESLDEIVDIDLEYEQEPMDCTEVMERLGEQLPPGMKFTQCELAEKRPVVAAADYLIDFSTAQIDLQQLQEKLTAFLQADEHQFSRQRGPKKPPRVFNARQFVDIAKLEGNTLSIRLTLSQQGGMKPSDLLQILGLDPTSLLVTKTETILVDEQTEETQECLEES